MTSSEISDTGPCVSADASGHSQQIPWFQDHGVAQQMHSRSSKTFHTLPHPDSFTLAVQGLTRHLLNWCFLLCPSATSLLYETWLMYILECWEGFGASGDWNTVEEDALWTLLDLSGRTGISHLYTQFLFSRQGPKQPRALWRVLHVAVQPRFKW